MKKLAAILLLLSFALPVRAEIVPDFDPIENHLLKKKMLEDELSKEFQKPSADQQLTHGKSGKKSSNWWKWALGIVIIGGVAAAASGGGGGGSTPPAETSGNGGSGGGGGGSSTGSVTASW